MAALLGFFRDTSGEVLPVKKKKTPAQLSWAPNATRELRVTTIGNARALVENHLGLLAYGAECVRVRCRRGVASVCGQGLALREVRRDALIVTGRIAKVELEHDPAAG